MTTVRLSSNSKENFDKLFERFCNILSLASQGGIIANDLDRSDPGASGRYWWMPNENKIDFYPAANNYWGFVRNKSEISATIDVKGRYDWNQKVLNAGIQLFAVVAHHSILAACFEVIENETTV